MNSLFLIIIVLQSTSLINSIIYKKSILHSRNYLSSSILLKNNLRNGYQRIISESITRKPLHFKLSDNDRSDKLNLVDLDDDDDDDEDDDDIDISDSMRKITKGLIPIAASVGFAVTPSPVIAARLVGAAAGGTLGLLVRSILIKKLGKPSIEISDGDFNGNNRDSILAPSVVRALKLTKDGPPLINLTVKGLETLGKKCNVPAEELGTLFTYIFAEVIYEAVQPGSLDLMELSEVMDFAVTMGLTPAEIGDGFALAANKVGCKLDRDERGFFTDEYPPEILYQAAKIFFLADKMIGSSEGYYGRRMLTSMSFFLPDSYKEIISDACTKLFRRCIEGVLGSPDDFTADEVDRLRGFLTTSTAASSLRPANMQNMIMEAIQFTLDSSLDTTHQSVMKASIGDYGKFVKAQGILGWSPRELTATLETRTMPIFENVVKELLIQAVDNPHKADELAETLQERISSLNIDVRKARVVLTTQISMLNSEYMNKIDKVYNVSGGAIEPAFKIMMSYANTHEAFKKITDKVMDGLDLPIPGLPFADMVRVSMFQMQITKGDMEKTGINDEMFDLNTEQRKLVRKTLALPKVSSWISQCISEGNFNANAKNAYKSLLTQYGVTDSDWLPTAIDFYYQEAEKIAKSKAVPSQSDMEKLTALKDFLECDQKQVEKVNLELLGDKYVKAVSECMTPTGVVTEEYLNGLNRLRVRLGLNEADSEKLLGVAARSRMLPIVKDLVDIWKSDTDANYRREKEKKEKSGNNVNVKDKSRDPISSLDNVFGYMEMGGQKTGGGPNVFMREALNLVDFFIENYGLQGIELSSDKDFPVNAVGIVPEGDLTGMLKHYLITRLAEPDASLRQRYIDNENLFASIIGINPEGIQKVKESLAYTAFTNLLKNVLTYKDTVEPQDIQQFAILKSSLDLTQEAADKIFAESCRKALIENAISFLRPQDGITSITAEMARRYRNQAQSLGLELQKDAGFNDKLVTYLYALEVQFLIENGLESELQEVQEAYNIPTERAEEIVEASCKRYISQLLNLALRAAKKYDEQDALRWLKEIVKYAVFVTGTIEADGNLFSEKDKIRLVSFYQAELAELADSEIDMVAKLKEMINLTDDFVPPVQGIEGLLGNVKSLSQIGRDGDKTKDGEKKPWAWG